MPVLTDKSNELRDTIISALLEINAACWYVRRDQNTRDGSAQGLLCMLPKEVQFEVQFGKDGSINAIARTQTETPGQVSEQSSETAGEQKSVSSSSVSDDGETSTQQSQTTDSGTSVSSTQNERGGDTVTVKRQYGNV